MSLHLNNNNNKKNNKSNGSSLSKIIKLIITVIIIYCIVSAVLNFFKKAANTVNEAVESITNNYVTNHTVDYDFNTDIDNVEVVENNNNNNTSSSGSFVSDNKHEYVKLKGNGNDEVTVMIYMIGTDLESQYGMATADINEILMGKKYDNINVTLQTGGCSKWKNSVFSNKEIERWAINSDNFLRLQCNLGRQSMTNPECLTDFIEYSADNFPANRNILILWDHGGGSATGYGYDENYPRSASMSPDIIGKAIEESGVKFDFIGFDACLMANLETAIAIEPYADYLIGSEETEPGEGWYYTNWIEMLDKNPSTPTVTLGKQIINDYVKTSQSVRGAEVTQSITDLGELIYNIKEPLITFSKAISEKINDDNYKQVATARGNTKEFSRSSRLDQVDLVDLASKFDVDGSDELIAAVKSAVKYNKTYNINNSYGISVYFPYSSLGMVNSMMTIYDNIDMDEEYTKMVKSFATCASSGQIVTQNSGSYGTSLFDILMGSDYSYDDSYYSSDNYYDILNNAFNNNQGGYDYYGDYGYSYEDPFNSGYDEWYDNSMIDLMSTFFGRSNILKPSALNIEEKNGQRVVSLTNDEWDLVDSVLLNMFIDDGNGFIDLGKDNVFEWNDQGDLIIDSDGTWLTVNDHPVAYYMVSDVYVDDSNYKTVGRIPAYLNNQKVDLIVNFTPENEYGTIVGAKLIYDSNIQQKGLIPINDGDVIKFICNYYTYDGEFVAEYQINDELVVNGELVLANEKIDNKLIYSYCFRDIYGNNMLTPKTVIE